MKSTPGAVLSPGHPFFSKKKDYSKRAKKPPKRYRYKATGGVPPDQLGPQPAPNAPVRPTSVQSGQSGNAGGGGAQQLRTVTRTVTTTTTTITIPSKNFVVQRPESVPNQDTIKSAKIGNDSYKGRESACVSFITEILCLPNKQNKQVKLRMARNMASEDTHSHPGISIQEPL